MKPRKHKTRDFSVLKQMLKEFCIEHNVEDIYLQPGNAGDALISSGTSVLLEDLDLTLNPVDSLDFDKLRAQNQTGIVFSGGGVLNQFYGVGWSMLNDIKSHGLVVFMLPCTISFDGVECSPFEQDDILFLREKISLSNCRNRTPSKTFLSHDLALYPPVDFWIQTVERNITFQSRIKLYKTILKQIGKRRFIRLISGQHVPLHAYRLDGESFFRPIGLTYNLDLSKIAGQASQVSWVENHAISAQFLFLLSRFKTVQTDRLHVSIGSFILSIECELRDGAYWKNMAVFDHSLATDDTSVVWINNDSTLTSNA